MSGDKEKVSARIDADLKQQLTQNESMNLSGLLRSLLSNYVRMGDAVEASLQRRLKDKENELNNKQLEKRQIENDIEQLERDIERIEEKIKERRNTTPEQVVEFAEKIKAGQFSEDLLDVENAGLKNWAQKAGLPPEKFRREVEDRL